jgi:hypothetical protein
MQLTIKAYHALPCGLEVFKINGKDADVEDFGETRDLCPEAAAPYSCADRQFVANEEPTATVLECYSISEDEWYEVIEELRETLAVGACGWCV